MIALTALERRYLAAMRELEMTRQPFGHRRIATLLGYRSFARSHQLMNALIEKGYISKAERLTVVPNEPVVNFKGRRELKRAA